MLPLGLLAVGERAAVVGIRLKEHNNHRHAKGKDRDVNHGRIEDMGLRAGAVVEMLNNKGRGALLIKVNDSRIAISRSMAMKIMVRRED